MTPPAHLQRGTVQAAQPATPPVHQIVSAPVLQTPPASVAPGPIQMVQAPPVEQTAQQAQPAPAAPAATPTLPPGMVLPPGMTPEMAAAFMAQFGGAQQAKKPRGRPRTPPVQPTNMDSTQVAGQGPNPAPQMVVGGPQPNGGGQPDQAVQSIMSTVKGLI